VDAGESLVVDKVAFIAEDLEPVETLEKPSIVVFPLLVNIAGGPSTRFAQSSGSFQLNLSDSIPERSPFAATTELRESPIPQRGGYKLDPKPEGPRWLSLHWRALRDGPPRSLRDFLWQMRSDAPPGSLWRPCDLPETVF